jgi:hypothetical protein
MVGSTSKASFTKQIVSEKLLNDSPRVKVFIVGGCGEFESSERRRRLI